MKKAMNQPSLKTERPAPNQEARLSAFNIPTVAVDSQDYQPPEVTPELAIETFGEAARQPVCDNLTQRCAEWRKKKAEIEKLQRIIPTLPIIENTISLRGLYEVMLPAAQHELWQIERHIRRLQHCLELLEQIKIFTKAADLPGYIDVKALKDRLDIVDIISREVELRQSGRTYKGRCSFHDDRSPSFVVYPEDQRWWCFACNEGGDVISFIQKIRNCSFREALTELQTL
jgi:hypothetical protein